MDEWALLLHLVGAILFFSGLVVATVGAVAARRRTRPSEVALLLGTARWGIPLVGVGALLALVAGFWLLAETAYGFDGWVVASLALLAVSALAGGLGGQGPKHARRLAERLAAEDDRPDAGLQAALRRPSADLLNLVAAVAAIAILVLMVFKPGA